MSGQLFVRPAVLQDAAALSAIYRPYVLSTAISFEYTAPDAEEFERRMSVILKTHPFLVGELDGRIAGYTYAGPFKDRAAYHWSAETSVYVDMQCRGCGIGTALYRELEKCLVLQNLCNLCACITWPNPQSVAFHERFGYQITAHFTKSGYKNNKWYDMIWMEKLLQEHTVPPKPFLPYPMAARRSS